MGSGGTSRVRVGRSRDQSHPLVGVLGMLGLLSGHCVSPLVPSLPAPPWSRKEGPLFHSGPVRTRGSTHGERVSEGKGGGLGTPDTEVGAGGSFRGPRRRRDGAPPPGERGFKVSGPELGWCWGCSVLRGDEQEGGGPR